MVVNGACKHGDMEHFKTQMADFKGDVHMEYLETHQLLALQGKGAPAALQVRSVASQGVLRCLLVKVELVRETWIGASPPSHLTARVW